MPILLKTHYSLAKQSLRRTRTRSFLTCLGIAIGIASLCLILSLMGSISALIETEVSSIGEGLVVIRPSTSISKTDSLISELSGTSSLTASSLTMKDVETTKTLKNISAAAPVSVSYHSVSFSDEKSRDSVPILSTTPDFHKIQPLPLSTGIFLSEKTAKNSAVLGSSLANSIFGTESPIGKTFTLLGNRFIIVGVLAETNDPINFNNIDLDSVLIINADFYSTLGVPLQISQLNIRLSETSRLSETVKSLEDTLKKEKSDNNFVVLSGSEITHPAGSLLMTTTYILSLVSAISLIVGGIGVMNIMLVSVAERTHEIGIRKAVGATNGNIFGEFIIESLLLSTKGGLLGILIGYLLALLISFITPFAPFISWEILALTFGTALVTGIFFGLFPALHAARKDPIRSLKSYY